MIMIQSSKLILDYDILTIVNYLCEDIDIVSPDALLSCNDF